MKLMKLTATRPHTYGTRHLVAGEEYEAPPRHAAALVAGRKAKFAKRLQIVPQEKPAAAPVPEQDARALELEALRAQATELGINVDGRWGLARLQFEIAQASK